MTLRVAQLDEIHLVVFIPAFYDFQIASYDLYPIMANYDQLGHENQEFKIATRAKYVLLIKRSIPGFVPTPYDHPGQSYIIVQLAPN